MIAGAITRVIAAASALALALTVTGFAAAPQAPAPPKPATIVHAGVDDFTFRSLDVDYTLTRADDGTSRLHVVERFVAEFPDTDQNHGMRRAIPDTYNGQPLRPELVSVTDETGAPRDAEVDSDDGTWSVTSRVDGFVHGAQTYVFTYDLSNVAWYFPKTGTEEFYWDVNGVEWGQSFGSVSATLHVDPALADSLTGQAACYVGMQGDTTTCPITLDTDAAAASVSVANVAPRQTVTLSVGFEPGTFVMFDSSYFASGWGWAQSGSFLALLGAFAWAIVVWRRVLRDSPGRGVVVAEYEPPAGVTPLTAAVLLSKLSKAAPAALLELAVRGAIRIEEVPGGSRARPKLRAVLVDPSLAREDGREFIDALFDEDAPPGAEFAFGERSTRLAKTAENMRMWAGAELDERGMYRSVPPGRRRPAVWALILTTAATIVTGALALSAQVDPAAPVAMFIVGALIGAIGFLLLAHRPVSPEGAETRERLAGLRLFISWAEADRIRMLQSPQTAERRPVDATDAAAVLAIYEPLLPYAVVFGLEKQWAAQLAVYYESTGAPLWYAGATAFNVSAFTSGVSSLSAAAVSSSSSSGGSTGGGSAGGGGGGGGGGGV
ncbi:DUF2207 domain-containing protein [Microbacterium sp. BG28]|uniref:DUF2207 domain-containing protein n=1 Tax=Microbacterium sp. BG28 TaxID=3097356 RepID=UPI002A5AE8EF|nr:DUF2207 domain-containing protein [Microbacterium sp. BG28]MDY0827912.1 DUF2207 domain-containing protein [Microbacterium sp. BG28]